LLPVHAAAVRIIQQAGRSFNGSTRRVPGAGAMVLEGAWIFANKVLNEDRILRGSFYGKASLEIV
jgi:hypothetical protein